MLKPYARKKSNEKGRKRRKCKDFIRLVQTLFLREQNLIEKMENENLGIDKLAIIDHPSQLEREKVECWLKEFLPKLKRTTSRTQKCRLLESVERLNFNDDRYAGWWKFVKFDKEGCGTIFRKNRKLEEFEQTEFQKVILENGPSFIDKEIGRWEIKEESGDWQLDDNLEKKVLSQGGEAIVLAENFDELETVVRVQVFDPFLFTEKFEEFGYIYEIHLSRGKNGFEIFFKVFF